MVGPDADKGALTTAFVPRGRSESLQVSQSGARFPPTFTFRSTPAIARRMWSRMHRPYHRPSSGEFVTSSALRLPPHPPNLRDPSVEFDSTRARAAARAQSPDSEPYGIPTCVLSGALRA
ncbi:hypothetical protein GY45DRAFT_721717 [Cubamyces sp. BRFM 1775]|nr:hypothetical protein GY45DRAFT_721717 [Cubamyces sp. BRFM 1775]